MGEAKRICVFYSRGPHFVRALAHLHERYPEAELTAMVPPGYPAGRLSGLPADIVRSGKRDYGMRDLAGFYTLVRQIRSGGYSHLVVLFDSPKLRILAALSGVGERYCYTVDGRYFPLELSLIPLILDTLYRNIRGRITYAYIQYIVRHRPVE